MGAGEGNKTMTPNEQRRFYPTGADLDAMGQSLARDVCLWTARLSKEYCNTYSSSIRTQSEPDPKPETRNHNKPKDAPPRVYHSQYIGVSVHRERWYMANWTVGGVAKRGRLRPRTDQGERWAAQDRARALGREYIEMRDGTRVPYLWKATEEMAA